MRIVQGAAGKFRKKRFEWGYLLLIPGIGYIVFFLSMTMFAMVMQSFGFYNFTGESAFTVENWRILLGRQFRDSLLFSIKCGVLSSLVSIILCYPLAMTMLRTPGKKTFMSIIKTPMFMPALVGSFLIINIIDYHGIVNVFLMWIGVISEPLRLRNDDAGIGVIVIQVWKNLPFQLTIMYAALEGIRSDIKDAARNLGASGFGVLRHIIIPLTIPSALVAVIFVFIRAFNDFAITSTAGPLYPNSVSNYMRLQANTYYNWGASACVGCAMVAAAILFVTAYTMLGKQLERLTSSSKEIF